MRNQKNNKENEDGVTCLEFECDDNLEQYVDSMLFDWSHIIAHGKFSYKGKEAEINLEVEGDARVIYKDKKYCGVGEFPTELRELIRNNRWWDCFEGVQADLHNWFGYAILGDDEGFLDGTIYEGDLSRATKSDILEEMKEIVKDYILWKEEAV